MNQFCAGYCNTVQSNIRWMSAELRVYSDNDSHLEVGKVITVALIGLTTVAAMMAQDGHYMHLGGLALLGVYLLLCRLSTMNGISARRLDFVHSIDELRDHISDVRGSKMLLLDHQWHELYESLQNWLAEATNEYSYCVMSIRNNFRRICSQND